MKIATWNVNSVNARLPTVLEVLKTCEADVWCLQEIKCVDEKFPREELEAAIKSKEVEVVALKAEVARLENAERALKEEVATSVAHAVASKLK